LKQSENNHKIMPNRTYLSESHRKYSEACQKEVERMAQHPLSAEQKAEQMRRNRLLSITPKENADE